MSTHSGLWHRVVLQSGRLQFTLNTEAACPSHTQVCTRKSTRRHKPDAYSQRLHRREKLESCICVYRRQFVSQDKLTPWYNLYYYLFFKNKSVAQII